MVGAVVFVADSQAFKACHSGEGDANLNLDRTALAEPWKLPHGT